MGLRLPVAEKWFENSNFSLQKAYVLSEIAESAYLNKWHFSRIVSYWGVKDSDWKSISCDGDTTAYLFKLGDIIFVTIGNSSINQIKDIIMNSVTSRVSLANQEGTMHGGFVSKLSRIWFDMRKWITEREYSHVYFTGHSIGGALAVIAMLWLRDPKNTSCYTFGSPRVGDKEFKQHTDNHYKLYHVVNNSDVITKLPLKLFGYRHSGEKIYINKYGLVSEYTWKEKLLSIRLMFTLIRKIGALSGLDNHRDHQVRNYKAHLLKYILHDKLLIEHYRSTLSK